MKKILRILLIIVIMPITSMALEFDITSQNAILYNLNDNTILYEKNKDEKISIASLTKIMTAIVAIEKIDNIDEKVIIEQEDFATLAEQNAAVAGFRIGEEVTYKDLLYGLLLPSGADAAQALMRLTAPSKEIYIQWMNEKAKELGMEHTNFINPTGLDIENHYSSVEDVATMFQYAIKNPIFKEIIQTSKYTTTNGRLTFQSTISKALKNYNLSMDYILGGKTGTTGEAGMCLATVATHQGVNYMLVTTRAPYSKVTPNSYNDQKKIYEYFMNHYSYQDIIKKGEIIQIIPTKYAKPEKIKIKSPKTITKYLENEIQKEDIEIQYNGIKEIQWNQKKGEKLGKITISVKGNKIETLEIKMPINVKKDWIKYIEEHKLFVIITSIIIVFIIGIILKRRMIKHDA